MNEYFFYLYNDSYSVLKFWFSHWILDLVFILILHIMLQWCRYIVTSKVNLMYILYGMLHVSSTFWFSVSNVKKLTWLMSIYWASAKEWPWWPESAVVHTEQLHFMICCKNIVVDFRQNQAKETRNAVIIRFLFLSFL